MNIMLITSMFPPIRTGSSFYSEDMARSLEKRGHNVIVTTLHNSKATEDNWAFPVHRLPAIHLENLFKKYFKHFRISSFFIRNYKQVSELVKNNNIEVIFLASHYHDIAFPAIYASLVNKIPVVVSINTHLQLNDPITSKVMRFFDRLICGKMVLPFCTKIISLDTEIERYLRDTYNDDIVKKSVIVPYGFHGDMEFYDNHYHDYELHNQIIGIGAVIEQRNFMCAIRVFKKLLNNFPNLKFKIIGHVYYDSTVQLTKELGIEDKVIFTGEFSHDATLNEIKKSDLYMGIFSGKYVGLGTATIESMLMGLPVVGNAPANLFGEELIIDGNNYVSVNTGDLDTAVEKASDLLLQRSYREKIGQNGRKFVRNYLNWDTIAEKTEDLLLEMTGKSPVCKSDLIENLVGEFIDEDEKPRVGVI